MSRYDLAAFQKVMPDLLDYAMRHMVTTKLGAMKCWSIIWTDIVPGAEKRMINSSVAGISFFHKWIQIFL